MVDGKMMCFGSVQHLKATHGSGYIIRIAAEETDAVPEPTAATTSDPGITLQEPLPSGWIALCGANGKVFYQNTVTRASQWEHPTLGSADVVREAAQALQRALPQAVPKDVYGGYATFHLDDPALSLATLFESLEEVKRTTSIKGYSVGQSSLESIFRGFAQKANEQLLVEARRQRVERVLSTTSTTST
jgi:hypothetical protein